MLKYQFKKFTVLMAAASLMGQVSLGADGEKKHFDPPTVQGESAGKEQTPRPSTEQTPRPTNDFSRYDALKEKLEHLSKMAPDHAETPMLVQGEENLVRIHPSKQQFADGSKTIERVKWYREQMKQTCEASDASAKLLGEFIDGCLTDFIFNVVKTDTEFKDKKPTFDLDAKKVRACRDDMNAYFEAKKKKVGEKEWKKYAIDQEIAEKLTKFYNWYGAAAEGIVMSEKEPVPMIEAIKDTTSGNLCLIEAEKAKQDNKIKEPEPKKAVPNQDQKPYQGPAQPSQDFKPPQVQNPAPQQPPQQQPPAYHPPQAGNYDPTGIGYKGNYDPRDRRKYNYDNFRDYGGKDYDTGMYLPLLANYPKGNNYIPPSGNNSLPPRTAVAPPPVGGAAPIGAPFLGRGFSLGLGFSNAYGYPYGGYFPPPLYGGGYGGGYPGYGGIGGGYIPVAPIAPIMPIEPISPCGGLIGGCGMGCGTGLITPCGGTCGGLINPMMPCGNNMLFNPMTQIPGRMVLPRGPINYPFSPYYNYGGMNPNRYTNPRIPGSPLQPVTPGTPGGTTPTNPTIPTTPTNPTTQITLPTIPTGPVSPIYSPINNPIGTSPIRITLPRTN